MTATAVKKREVEESTEAPAAQPDIVTLANRYTAVRDLYDEVYAQWKRLLDSSEKDYVKLALNDVGVAINTAHAAYENDEYRTMEAQTLLAVDKLPEVASRIEALEKKAPKPSAPAPKTEKKTPPSDDFTKQPEKEATPEQKAEAAKLKPKSQEKKSKPISDEPSNAQLMEAISGVKSDMLALPEGVSQEDFDFAMREAARKRSRRGRFSDLFNSGKYADDNA